MLLSDKEMQGLELPIPTWHCGERGVSDLQTLCYLMESPAGQMEVEGTKTQICFCTWDYGLSPGCQKEEDGMCGILPIVLIFKPAPFLHHQFSGCIL